MFSTRVDALQFMVSKRSSKKKKGKKEEKVRKREGEVKERLHEKGKCDPIS